MSIILPTFDRASFLPAAFEAIAGQSFDGWELIVVDDGSRDATAALVHQWQERFRGRLRYVYQENAGAYAARARGVALARGAWIAFYDSDDVWLPHHLASCLALCREQPDVDWVWAASAWRVAGDTTGRAIVRPFPKALKGLRTRRGESVWVFDDPRTAARFLRWGHGCELQTSLIRREVFAEDQFWTDLRNGEDRFFVVRAIKRGVRIARLDRVNCIYVVHQENSSAVGSAGGAERRARVYASILKGYERLYRTQPFTPSERCALRHRLAHDWFWHLGYATYMPEGRWRDAFGAFRRGLGWWPVAPRMWKTAVVAAMKAAAALPRARGLSSFARRQG